MIEKKEKEKKKTGNIKIILTSLIILIFIGFLGYAGLSFAYNYINTKTDNGSVVGAIMDMVINPDSPILKKEYITMLLVGTNDGLTDTLMVARVNTKTKKIALLSIPRDTYVPKGIDNKINSLNNWKGINETKTAIENIIGVKIDYYAMINTKAVVSLVDAIGGVEFNVPIKMDYDDPSQNLHIHLKQGLQTLNGTQAEGLLRFRKGYKQQDLERINVQREFIGAAMKTLIKPENILKANTLIDIGLKNVKTDMSVRIILDFVKFSKNVDLTNIASATIPGEATMINERSYFKHSSTLTKKLIESMFYNDMILPEEFNQKQE